MDTELGRALELWKRNPGDEQLATALLSLVNKEIHEGRCVTLRATVASIKNGSTSVANALKYGVFSGDGMEMEFVLGRDLKAAPQAQLEFKASGSLQYLGFGNLLVGHIAFFELHEVASLETVAPPPSNRSSI